MCAFLAHSIDDKIETEDFFKKKKMVALFYTYVHLH